MKIKKQLGSPNNRDYRGSTIDVSTLDILCKYVVSPPTLVKLSHVSNLNHLMKSLDKVDIENDPEKSQRAKFINLGIDARLNYNLNDINLIVNHILTRIDFEPKFVDLSGIKTNNYGFSADEINWVNTTIIEGSNKWGFMERDADTFLDICTRIKSTDFAHRGDLANEFETLIDLTKNNFRKVTKDDSITSIEFSLKPGDFEEDMREIHEVLSSPSRRLVCGMQGMNKMTNGGWESTRVYTILGVTGGGKSMTLLDIAQQIKKYNKNYKPKDPTRIPVVVYLTMENSVVETVNRLFVMTTQSDCGIGNMKLDTAINKLRSDGGLVLDDNNPIDIFIKYKPNLSVDTTYLYTLYDNLHDRGYEPICFIQDHLMRIKSVNATGEVRFDLGSIVNEFKTFATEKDIPFLTNFHLNREAMEIVEKYKDKVSNIDVTQKLGKHNVSESVQILNNTDSAIIINKEADEQGNLYMAFNMVKMRDKVDLDYFAQPFTYGSEIKLVEDIDGPPMYKVKVRANAEVDKISNIKTSSSNIMNKINNIIEESPTIDLSSMMHQNSTFSFDNSNNFIIDDPIEKIDDAPDEEFKLMKKPPITNPIIYYNTKPLQNTEQKLTFESLRDLRSSLIRVNDDNVVSPLVLDETEFTWDDISRNIASKL